MAKTNLWQKVFAPALRRWAAAWKLAARRYTVRSLRLIFDALDDRLHAAEVRLRNDLSVSVRVESPRTSRPAMDTVQSVGAIADDEFLHGGIQGRFPSDHQPERLAPAGSFSEWEARRSGFRQSLKKKRADIANANLHANLI